MFKAWVTTASSRDGSHICARAAASTSFTNCTPLFLPHCAPVSMSNIVATLENLTTFGISSAFKTLMELNQVLAFTGKNPQTQQTSKRLSFEKDPHRR